MAFKTLKMDEKAYGIFLRKLGKKLTSLRTESNKSRVDLAKSLDVTAVTIANWEAGKGITMRTMYVYSKLFRKSVPTLLLEANV